MRKASLLELNYLDQVDHFSKPGFDEVEASGHSHLEHSSHHEWDV